MNALVIEDDPIIAFHLEDILLNLSFDNVTIVEELQSVQNINDSEQFDFVISNLKLQDGWADASFLIKLSKSYNNVLVITGLSNKKLHNIDLDNIQTLYKPFTTLQIQKLVLKIFQC